ncbi:MAG: hypothetical protein IH623_04760 [Verrucomicrobia bacterium]|nr:hypothetical protein [Verrucomicrobiota bacterium]
MAKLLRRKSPKPPKFNTVVRAVVGGSKVADRRKLLRDYLQDHAETDFRKRTRPLDLGTPREFDPKFTLRAAVARMEEMQKPGFFTKASVEILAADFSRWKAQRDQRVRKEKSKKASVASVESRRP